MKALNSKQVEQVNGGGVIEAALAVSTGVVVIDGLFPGLPVIKDIAKFLNRPFRHWF